VVHTVVHKNYIHRVLPKTLNAVRALEVIENTDYFFAVTAEAAGSSPVVPAIPFNGLQLGTFGIWVQ
jgi:hypothetical protein